MTNFHRSTNFSTRSYLDVLLTSESLLLWKGREWRQKSETNKSLSHRYFLKERALKYMQFAVYVQYVQGSGCYCTIIYSKLKTVNELQQNKDYLSIADIISKTASKLHVCNVNKLFVCLRVFDYLLFRIHLARHVLALRVARSSGQKVTPCDVTRQLMICGSCHSKPAWRFSIKLRKAYLSMCVMRR